MPIVIDITHHSLEQFVQESKDDSQQSGYRVSNGLCRQLKMDDNDVLTLYSYDEQHYQKLLHNLHLFYFFFSDDHLETPVATECPENFSIAFSGNNIRELLSYLHHNRTINEANSIHLKTQLNDDPEHINRQIESIKTWESHRLQLNGFKTLSDDNIRDIINFIKLRKRHFKYLELNDNGITDDQAIYLAKNLKYIFKIYLNNNAITDIGAAAIIKADKFLTVSFRSNKLIINKDNVIYDAALLTRYCNNIGLRYTGVSRALIINIGEHSQTLRQRGVESYTHMSTHDAHSILWEEKVAREQKAAQPPEIKAPIAQNLLPPPSQKLDCKGSFRENPHAHLKKPKKPTGKSALFNNLLISMDTMRIPIYCKNPIYKLYCTLIWCT